MRVKGSKEKNLMEHELCFMFEIICQKLFFCSEHFVFTRAVWMLSVGGCLDDMMI